MPLAAYGYAVRPLILVMFLSIVKPEGRYGIAWLLISIDTAVMVGDGAVVRMSRMRLI